MDMHLPAQREKDLQPMFVIALVVILLGFAVWLKVLPNLGPNLGASSTVKLWVDPSHDFDTLIKLAPVGSFLFLVLLIPASMAGLRRPQQSIPVIKFATRDVFTGSRHWSRPPPLF